MIMDRGYNKQHKQVAQTDNMYHCLIGESHLSRTYGIWVIHYK